MDRHLNQKKTKYRTPEQALNRWRSLDLHPATDGLAASPSKRGVEPAAGIALKLRRCPGQVNHECESRVGLRGTHVSHSPRVAQHLIPTLPDQ
jgi:hypothetical protein